MAGSRISHKRQRELPYSCVGVEQRKRKICGGTVIHKGMAEIPGSGKGIRRTGWIVTCCDREPALSKSHVCGGRHT